MNTDRQRVHARQLVNNPVFLQVLNDMERAEIDRVIHAEINDHETRQNAAAEVRAIRSFRDRVSALAADPKPAKQAPA